MSVSRLLVIGGTGFIGHHLLKEAQRKGWQNTSVSLNPPKNGRLVNGVRYLYFDLSDRGLAHKYLQEDFNFVVNLGGYINHQLFKHGGGKLIETHFNSLQNLIEVLPRDKLKRFVQIGSSDEYGNAPAPQHEALREQPISPYSLAKLACTHFLQMLHRTENFPAVILRLFLTYGPGQDPGRFMPQIIYGCLDDIEFSTSEGEQLRDFCYVEDTVKAIMKSLIISDAVGEVFNVSSGVPVSIRTVIEKICSIIRTGKPLYGEIPYRGSENMELYANIDKIQQCLHWKQEMPLGKGLQKTIDWYSAHER